MLFIFIINTTRLAFIFAYIFLRFRAKKTGVFNKKKLLALLVAILFISLVLLAIGEDSGFAGYSNWLMIFLAINYIFDVRKLK